MEEAMADLVAQNLPHNQAEAAADAILARFMPDAFAALQPAAAAAQPISKQSAAQRPFGVSAASLAHPRQPSAAQAQQERSSGVVTPRKRQRAGAASGRKPPDAPRKKRRTVSRSINLAGAEPDSVAKRTAAGGSVLNMRRRLGTAADQHARAAAGGQMCAELCVPALTAPHSTAHCTCHISYIEGNWLLSCTAGGAALERAAAAAAAAEDGWAGVR